MGSWVEVFLCVGVSGASATMSKPVVLAVLLLVSQSCTHMIHHPQALLRGHSISMDLYIILLLKSLFSCCFFLVCCGSIIYSK